MSTQQASSAVRRFGPSWAIILSTSTTLLLSGCPSDLSGLDASPDGVPDTSEVLDQSPDLGPNKPLVWASIKAGSFKMGSPTTEKCRTYDEEQHDVTLTHPFRMSTTEISQSRFYRLMRYLRAGFEGCGPDCPVENVTWHEAAYFCNVLSAQEDLTSCYTCAGKRELVHCDVAKAYEGKAFYSCAGYRLPTEAEWEYAYRAGTTTAFYSGEADFNGCGDTRDAKTFPDPTQDPTLEQNIYAIAWYVNSADDMIHAGGQKKPNAWGLYDMAGNTWEWVNDWRAAYPKGAASDPTGPAAGSYRLIRGGGIESMVMYLRAAYRDLHSPTYADEYTGFRIVQTTK